MQFSDLQTFIILNQCQSFSKASQMLYISQPALTQRIQKLEAELGFPVIDRKQKNLFSLTKAGERFLSFATETDTNFKDMLSECRELAMLTKPSFVIGIEQFDLHFLNRDAFLTHTDLQNQYEIQIEYCMHRDLLEHLYAKEYDCVFMAKPQSLPKGYSFLETTTDSFACIYSPENHLSTQIMTMEDILENIIYFPEESYEDFQNLEKGLKQKKRDIAVHYYQTISLLSSSKKNCIYISNLAKKEVFTISKCVPLQTDEKIHLGFVYRNTISNDFLNFLKEL